jgi:hypothetical protein
MKNVYLYIEANVFSLWIANVGLHQTQENRKMDRHYDMYQRNTTNFGKDNP